MTFAEPSPNPRGVPGRSYRFLRNATRWSTFGFGYGLSYTQFTVAPATATATATAISAPSKAVGLACSVVGAFDISVTASSRSWLVLPSA